MTGDDLGSWLIGIGVCIIIAIGAVLMAGCRTGQAINLNGCHNCTIKLDSGAVVNSKETPFDIFRGMGQGAMVPVGQTPTISGSTTTNTQGK